MEIKELEINGLLLIKPFAFKDERGAFIKSFNADLFNEKLISCNFKETFYSVSQKNVLRGMHFQRPPYDVDKLVYVSRGRALDVVLDIRKNSPTYGNVFETELSFENNMQLFIPKGLAHGFLSLEDSTCMHYMQSDVYSSEHDDGIHYDSFGYNWKCIDPIISKRDEKLPRFDQINSPF